MKYILALMVVFSTSVLSAEIEDGNFEIAFDGYVSTISRCSTFTDGRVVGISNSQTAPLTFTYEMEVPAQTDLSVESFSTTKKLGALSAEGFCAAQNLLSSLEITYTKSLNTVSMSYKYRCNRKLVTKTVSCSQI